MAVACCDLDVAVAEGRLPMPPGHAVGHEGVAEVVAVGDAVREVKVGDRVIVPFQISCGDCPACRRGVTGSCASLPLMAMYGMAPLAGLDGGGFMADLVLVPYADAMLVPVRRHCRSGRDRLVVGQHPRRLARRRSLPRGVGRDRPRGSPCSGGGPPLDRVVRRGVCVGLRRAGRLRRHRPAAAGRRRKARCHSA